MNFTPLIDVLPVLLVILIVIGPATLEMMWGTKRLSPEVLGGNRGDLNFRINQQVVSWQDLPARLVGIYANRAARGVVKGDDRLQFDQIAEVIDLSHAAGVDHVGWCLQR